jgi:uncharacterized protein with ATP-grasp and redox domains
VGWFFDDNGETVLDLRFLNQAISETDAQFVLFVNSVPVSENVTANQLMNLIHDGSFPNLVTALQTGRAHILKEAQYLAGLEKSWLTQNGKAALATLDLVLFKGASLYESFQDTGLDAYYGLVVAGPNSHRLTGREMRSPVLIHSPKNHSCH